MAVRVTIRDADTGNKIDMELEPQNTIEDVIESAASYWQKSAGAYVLRHGKKLLQGQLTVKDAKIHEKDVLELIPDPEGGAG